MSIKPQYETYRYTSEICRLRAQSMVECRLPGSEIGSVLAVHAVAIPLESACENGEVRYSGKLLLCVVYEDGARKICRVERGVEFFHKAEHSSVSPACFAKTALTCESVLHRREGSGLYISVVVGGEISVFGSKQIEYVSGGDHFIVQKQPIQIYKSVCVSGETEGEDEFDCDYVGDILMHDEQAVVKRVRASAGQIEIEGDLVVHACVLASDDKVVSYERLFPFSMEIPCDEAFGNVQASARVCIKSTSLNVGADEEKNKSKVVLSYCLSADCFLHASEELSVVKDAFCKTADLLLKTANDGGMYLTNVEKATQRVGGTCSLSSEVESEYRLEATLLPQAYLQCVKQDNGYFAEGALTAILLFKSEDNGYKTSNLTLPIRFPMDCKDADEIEIDALVCGLNVRRQKDGQTEAEATLQLCLRGYAVRAWSYINQVQEGECYPPSDAAISLFALRAGETLWDAAKRLKQSPEELQASNSAIEFPVKTDANVLIYKQIH